MKDSSTKYARGTVWWCKDSLNGLQKGVQKGKRPALIISSNTRGKSTVVEVVKITRTNKSRTCPKINIPVRSPKGHTEYILCNQHFTVNVEDLDEYMYTVSPEVMRRVNKGLLVCQGMDTLADLLEVIDDSDKLTEIVKKLKEEKLRE